MRAKLCMCIQVWDFATGEVLRTLKGHTDYVMSVAISPCGKYVISGSSDKTVKVAVLYILCVYRNVCEVVYVCAGLGLRYRRSHSNTGGPQLFGELSRDKCLW